MTSDIRWPGKGPRAVQVPESEEAMQRERTSFQQGHRELSDRFRPLNKFPRTHPSNGICRNRLGIHPGRGQVIGTMTAIPMIQGTWNTLLLPLNSHGSIDWERLEANVDALIESEVSGVYTNGTAGEFYNQTEEEFDRISVMMAERCRKADRPFQIGVSHSSPWQSRERLRRVAELDPLAFQVILPEWFPPVLEECRIFIEEMAAAAGGRP